ncbi:hypothetical protein OGX80_11090 [Citrobacter sp. CK194]|uniref:Uncharacterized protein n=1 Tax=Citrobacter koseri TaxID=545 RepID=A0A3S5DPA4_CITKO|nr:hypothetical protein [Citrobacter sp. CK194]MDM3025359.1 hypothetical protein [Citrobacter sp. CK194]VEB94213.1 Uncharacterised protein [Citrobacter koseri]HBL7009264.1 hypothetical protein [Citrobacter koseri]
MKAKEQKNLEKDAAVEEKRKLIRDVIETLAEKGIPPEITLMRAGQVKGRGSSALVSTAPNQRIKCVYNSTEYIIPVVGNVSYATKQAIVESGLNREQFIGKYKVA